ncbi:MAG: YgeY family selenium metabolism-linked hydrolase [Desulfovibrio sp.]|nr:YgeY family selenium metabolism-linked hydrolase [Desulfovibrio sp.]
MLDSTLRQSLDACHDGMIRFARKLITLPSVTGEEALVARAITDEMRQLGYDGVTVDSVGNVLGVIRGGGGGEHILYNCHMDQVDPGNLEAWEYPPFEAVTADGYIHGRGASDTKGAIAPQIYAAAAVKQAGTPHKGDILVSCVVDEEPGDMWGMRRQYDEVLAKYPGRIGLLVLGEATGLNIYLGHRGKVEILLGVSGRVAHSSAPWRGSNAVYKMQPVIRAIEELNERLPGHDFLTRSSIALTNITCSPGWLSTVPDRCVIRVDRRFLPHENGDSILAELEGILRACGLTPGRDAEIAFDSYAHTSYTGVKEALPLYKPAFLTPKDEPHVAAALKALNGIGQQPDFRSWDFGTDGAWLATECNIPAIGYAPTEEQYAHTPLDRVSMAMMRQSLHGYAAISLALTG